MCQTTEKESPWKKATVKKNAPASKEVWRTPKEVKAKAAEVQKFKKNNPSSLNQPFDAQ